MARLIELTTSDMAEVNTLIQERMQSPVGMIPDLGAHLINAGGKRVRPMVTLAAAQLVGYQGRHHVKLAATVEFIHTATLLHDDVVDESALRRGRRTANLVWGNAPSVLVGDFLFARSFNLMVECGSMRVLDILARTSSVIAEGEVRQLAAAHNAETTVEEYLAIIKAKTAALFAASAQISAVIAERPEAEVAALARFGHELGMAFQLVDDALDYGGAPETLGKNVGDDFREGKVTMPVALAFMDGDDAERAFWIRAFGEEQTDQDFKTAQAYLEAHGAVTRTLEAARVSVNTAKAALEIFPPNETRDALREFADFVVDRIS